MALTSSTVQQTTAPSAKPALSASDVAAPLLGALMLAAFTAQKGTKAMRQLKKQAVVALFKYRMASSFARIKSLFSKKAPATIDNRTLLYILLGLAVLILVFIEPVVAIVLLLLGILLILLTK